MIQLSIITVVYNNVKSIESTILNILKVKKIYSEVEFIIVDGGSTDGTVAVIKEYDSKIDFWISEPDKGIYDAMNKATLIAKGEWINFMNSGDEFVVENFRLFYNAIFQSCNDVVYGDVIIKKGSKLQKIKARPISEINYSLIFCHQSSFVRRELLLKNNFVLNYKISSDYDFFLKIFLQGAYFSYLAYPAAIFEYGGLSSGISKQYIIERLYIICNLHHKIKDKLYFSFKFIKALIPFNTSTIF